MAIAQLDDLSAILNPRAVAIVGASNSPGKIGNSFTRALIDAGFPRIYPINPRESQIAGLRAYPRVVDAPDDIDLAYIVTPTAAVLEAVKECAAKGVKGIVVHTSGFAEHSAEGALLQQRIVELARASGSRVIGPNCVGIYSPKRRLPCMLPGLPMESGQIAMISQSGSFGEYLVKAAYAKGLRFAAMVSVGNEADLGMADFLQYFGADPEVEVICAYVEGVRDGRRFVRVAREASRAKPVIVLKAGVTEEGRRAASSHTGALGGSRRVWEAALRQAGVIAPRTVEAMIDTLVAAMRLQKPKGDRVAIVSGPGGPAVLATDAVIEEGLRLAELSGETVAELGRMLPSVGTSFRNPVDAGMATINGPKVYRPVIELLDRDRGVDAVLAVGVADMRCAEAMVEANRGMSKPLMVVGLMPPEAIPEWYRYQAENGVAVFSDARRAAAAHAAMWNWTRGRQELR